MKAKQLCFSLVLFVCFSTSALAQEPPGSPDCWRCVVKFCAEKVRTVYCPQKRCEEVWVLDPNDPNRMNKKYTCSQFRLEHYAEILQDQVTYNSCSQGGVGFVMTDRRQSEVVCSFLYRCVCVPQKERPVDALFCAQGSMIGPEEVRIHDAFGFSRSLVCVYVEATPDPVESAAKQ